MRVFWAPQTRSQRIVWMLEEAGIDYEMEAVDIRGENREDTTEFLAASPMGKVPAIVDGDVAMSESAAICIYVADRYSMGTLAPAVEDPQRGKYLYWVLYTPAVVEPTMSEKIHQVETNRFSSGWGNFDLMIETWDNALEGREWILGDQFTAADVMLGSSAIFLGMFNMLPETRNIGAYGERCLARPSNQRAMEKTQNG